MDYIFKIENLIIYIIPNKNTNLLSEQCLSNYFKAFNFKNLKVYVV